MAEEQELRLDADNTTSKVSKKIIIIVVVVLLLLITAGVGAFFVLGSDDQGDNQANAAEEQAAVEQPIQYHTLAPSFVVNFVTQTRQHYVKLGIDVVTRNPEVITALEHHEPMVRNEILRVVGEKGFNSLRDIDKKIELQKELKTLLSTILSEEAGVDGLQAVIFTEFVMQ